MKLELEAAGKAISIEVEAPAGVPRVRVDGRDVDLEAHWLSARDVLLRIDRRVFEAQVVAAGDDACEVAIGGHQVRIGSGAGPSAREVASRPRHHGGQLIAPMPGKIVAVLVAPGESVEPGQGLVVIEAMKMENELQASAAGRVRAVHVVPGQVVEGGVTLVEIA